MPFKMSRARGHDPGSRPRGSAPPSGPTRGRTTRDRQIDVLLTADEHAPQRRPAARQIRHHRLEVGLAIGSAAVRDDVAERRTRQARVGPRTDGVEHGWQQVDVPHSRINHAAARLAASPGSTVAMMSGMRAAGASYVNTPCVASPCWPSDSPWSPVTMTRVGRGSARRRSRSGPRA